MTPSHNGAHGTVHLLTDSDALTASVRRTVRLEATPNGKSLLLIDVDSRRSGIHREVRYEITPDPCARRGAARRKSRRCCRSRLRPDRPSPPSDA